MVAQIKTITLKDNSHQVMDVHYIRVNKGNRKGAAAAFGGQLYDHSDGTFHINLKTKVNDKVKTIVVVSGDFVFCTGTNNRWQVKNLAAFNKRFSNVGKI